MFRRFSSAQRSLDLSFPESRRNLLHVLMHGQPMGRLIAQGGAVTFHYENSWLERHDNFP